MVVLAVLPFAHLVLTPAIRPCGDSTGGACSCGLLLSVLVVARPIRPGSPSIRSGLPRRPARSAARRRALRARGLAATSAADGVSEGRVTRRRRGLVSADADRHLRRADAAPPLRRDEPLDDPVLERVVAEDDEPATGPEEIHGRGEARLERLELLVDRDAQRLEHAGRGMRATRLARVRRRHALDQAGELLGGRRSARSSRALDDGAGDPAGLGSSP